MIPITKTSKIDEVIKRVEAIETELAKNSVTTELTLRNIREIKECLIGVDYKGGLVSDVKNLENRVRTHEKIGGIIAFVTGLILSLQNLLKGG